MRIARMILAASVFLSACTGARLHLRAPSPGSLSPQVLTPSASPALLPSPSGSPPAEFLPAPDAAVPKNPARLADALVEVTQALDASIDRWRKQANAFDRAPENVVLQALYQQRICRTLAGDTKLAAAAVPGLPGRVRVLARTVVEVSSLFHGLVRPVSNPSSFKTGPPKPAGALLRYYREAERRFGVEWEVLAALNYIESKFGRVRSTSYAGAQGPMQFIPSTWAVYGMGGDINDPHDAILGAADYLHRSGAPGHYRQALFAYNHAWPYVDGVLLYARLMKRDIGNYFAMYNWQVFVLTTKGSQRLTGPGLGWAGGEVT